MFSLNSPCMATCAQSHHVAEQRPVLDQLVLLQGARHARRLSALQTSALTMAAQSRSRLVTGSLTAGRMTSSFTTNLTHPIWQHRSDSRTNDVNVRSQNQH
jgi:hypothetical protein